MRVGLYLEFLTFLGICEAVKDEVGDLLSAAERAALRGAASGSPRSASRSTRPPGAGCGSCAGSSSRAAARRAPGRCPRANLLAKRKATLRFLHVHHDDLKHAIRLAGPNHHNAQETWQRVFRDAERAVLRNVAAAFPELESVSRPARDFILWHRKGRFELGRTVRLPGAVSGLFADQDGLYGSACVQYRDSMNDVADWAKERGLMDHTGRDCVPRQVSLLEAHVNQPARVALLQHHDGYGPDLEVGAELPETYQRPAAEIETLIAGVPILAHARRRTSCAAARARRPPAHPRPDRAARRTGRAGRLAVRARRRRGRGHAAPDDGEDVLVDTMGKGAVVGEMSLLTGEPRTATVRALDGAVVYEIGAQAVRAGPARAPGAGRRARAAHGRAPARAPPSCSTPARPRASTPPSPGRSAGCSSRRASSRWRPQPCRSGREPRPGAEPGA